MDALCQKTAPSLKYQRNSEGIDSATIPAYVEIAATIPAYVEIVYSKLSLQCMEYHNLASQKCLGVFLLGVEVTLWGMGPEEGKTTTYRK